MFRNFSDLPAADLPPVGRAADALPAKPSAPRPRVRIGIDRALAPPSALDDEVTVLRAAISQREATLAKEQACGLINGMRVRRVTRELALLRHRLVAALNAAGATQAARPQTAA